MTDLVTAMVYTITKFVAMLFSMQIDPNISVGSFLLAVAILGAVIRLVFALIRVPGQKWAAGYNALKKDKEA